MRYRLAFRLGAASGVLSEVDVDVQVAKTIQRTKAESPNDRGDGDCIVLRFAHGTARGRLQLKRGTPFCAIHVPALVSRVIFCFPCNIYRGRALACFFDGILILRIKMRNNPKTAKIQKADRQKTSLSNLAHLMHSRRQSF